MLTIQAITNNHNVFINRCLTKNTTIAFKLVNFDIFGNILFYTKTIFNERSLVLLK
jgi:hypothetical protein